MKTIRFSILGFFLILFTACSSDDSPEINTAMVTGEWNIESFDYSGQTSGNFEGMELNTSYEGVGENIEAVLRFNADNTFNFSGSYDVKFTAEGFTEMVPVSNASSSGTWKIEGDYIITSETIGQVQGEGVQGPQEGRMKISEVSENRMILIIDQESTTNQNGMEFTISMDGKYVLTR